MSLLYTILLSIAPVSELRGGIPYGLSQGFNPVLVYAVTVISNFIAIPIMFTFLDIFHNLFYKISAYRAFFNKIVERNRHKIESKIGTKAEFYALMLFVAVPLPITGAYTGTLIAWFFNLKRKKSYLALTLGILIAGMVVLLLSLAGLSFFK